MTPNIADIIRHHVALEVRCIDRVYLHAYMPKLQTSGGLCYFLHDYLGHPSLLKSPSGPRGGPLNRLDVDPQRFQSRFASSQRS